MSLVLCLQLWDLSIEDPYHDDGRCQKVITEHSGTVKVSDVLECCITNIDLLRVLTLVFGSAQP